MTEDRRQAVASATGTDGIVQQIQRLSLNSGDADGSETRAEGVQFVYLPHDTSKAISTVVLPLSVMKNMAPGGDFLPTYVKSFFADGRTIDEGLFNESVAKHNLVGGDLEKFAAQAAKEKGKTQTPSAKLTSNALTNATSSGSVETFPLVRPASTNQKKGVYIYLDEVGMLKNLPLNSRASKLAGQCGFVPEPKFYGDVFVGRVEANNFALRNVDLKREEILDSTSAWLVRAPGENLEWQQSFNDMKGATQESANDGTDGVAVNVEGDGQFAYSWLQSEDEVELTVALLTKEEELDGKKATKSLIKVSFRPQKILVKYDDNVKVEVELYSKIDVDGCTWTLDKNNLILTGEKADPGNWPRLQLGA